MGGWAECVGGGAECRVVPDIQLAGYPAFFDIRYPAGYLVSFAGYPAGWITEYPV